MDVPQSRDRSQWTHNALSGAAMGGLLLALEALLGASVDGTTFQLGRSVFLVWGVGLVGGGLLGLVLGNSGRSAKSGVVLLFATAITVVQINNRWLPDAMDPKSLAVSGGLAIAFVWLFVRWRGRPAPVAEGIPWMSLALGMGLSFLATVLPGEGWTVSVWEPGSVTRPVPEAPGGRQLLLLGIDGGRWETIDPLLESGRMPNLAGLVARGRRGVLRSTVLSQSPVVWTTIMTGRPPELHGIDDWERSVSTNRRVAAVWNMLDALGMTTYVANVPGTFPAEPVRGGMLAGFPLPQGSRSNGGWRVHTDPTSDARGPVSVPVDFDGDATVALPDLPPRFALEGSTPYLVLRRILGEATAVALARRLVPVAQAVLDVAAIPGGVRLSWDGSPLAEMSEGAWSPWLVRTGEGGRLLFRVRAMEAGPDVLDLYVTPLFREGEAGQAFPPDLARWVQQADTPYVAEGAGWQIFYEPAALGPLEEHLTQLGAGRADGMLRLLADAPWDAVVHVYTLTDRIQHGYWKFREPELYAGLTESPMYETHRASEADVRDFGGAIDRAYESVDVWLGEFLEHATDSTLVVVVSDHGGQGGPHPNSPTAGIHHEDGIYLLAGPTVTASSVLGPPMDQVDIVPLVLAHLDLPGSLDFAGSVPEALLPMGPAGDPRELPDPFETYETRWSGSASGEVIGEAVRDQLRSLGYLK